jgi:serine/threonine protein kinase
VVDVIIEPEPPASLRKRPFNVIYIVFEYGGIDLKKWMLSFQGASRPTPEAVSFVMKQMVAACGYLHRCSVVHRDIKPVNILIDPESLALRVADFGLSRVMQLTPEEEQQLASHHNPVRSFEPQLPPSSRNEPGGPSALLHTNRPSESAAGAEFSSDDSDVECDSPSLRVRQATKEVVTIWCAFHYFALITTAVFRVQSSDSALSRWRAPEVGLCRGRYSQAIDVWGMGCIFAELLHCMQRGSDLSNGARVLFPAKPGACRCETKQYAPPIREDEMLGLFCSVLGPPSREDIEEFAEAARVASGSNGQAAYDETIILLTSWSSQFSPVDFSVKYSDAASSCPEALPLLACMLCYSPSKRISCSHALRHAFLNPHNAAVSVDGLAGDDGHARAMRAAVCIRQLNIEKLCQDRDITAIGEFLIAEAADIKLPGTPLSAPSSSKP